MGFGHRVYRVRDPRADALKARGAPAGRGLQRHAGPPGVRRGGRGRGAGDPARSASPTARCETNVEFYTALLLEALAFPPAAFTCVFAMGRVAGWIAHAREQLAGGRLIRPQSRYVGPMPKVAA